MCGAGGAARERVGAPPGRPSVVRPPCPVVYSCTAIEGHAGWVRIVAAPEVAEATPPTFGAFVQTARLVPFMRRVIDIAEAENGLLSHHLCVSPWRGELPSDPAAGVDGGASTTVGPERSAEVHKAAESCGFFVTVIGSSVALMKEPAVVEHLNDLDRPIEYTDACGRYVEVPGLTPRDLLVCGHEPGSPVRCGLDFQGRPCYVATLSPAAPAALAARTRGLGPVRRQAELSDGELEALWRAVAKAVAPHNGFFQIHLNTGSCQNVAHIHLKAFVDEASFVQRWGGTLLLHKLRAQALSKAHGTPPAQSPSPSQCKVSQGTATPLPPRWTARQPPPAARLAACTVARPLSAAAPAGPAPPQARAPPTGAASPPAAPAAQAGRQAAPQTPRTPAPATPRQVVAPPAESSAQAPAGEAASWRGLLACVCRGARRLPGDPAPPPQAALAGAGAQGQRWTLPGATTMEQIGDTIYVPVKALAPGAVLHARPPPWVVLNQPRFVPQAC